MSSITDVAHQFFAACEAGLGWEACHTYCTEDASFSAQAEPLVDVVTLQAYCDWMHGLLQVLTDGHYEIKSFATDTERNIVCAFAVFTGTHLAGGPCAPTGKTTNADYVYVMHFDGEKISHMTKIWNSTITLKELGWA